MRRIWSNAALLAWVGACLSAGCGVQGLSGPGKTATLGYDLTLLRERAGAAGPEGPALAVAVAQAGATIPDARLLDALRGTPGLFAKVRALPACPEVRDFASEVTQRDPEELLKLAEQMDCDLLFLVGGQLDSSNSRTPANLLDATVIGNYTVPANSIRVRGQALGVAIAVRQRRLLFTVDADVNKNGFAPSASRNEKEERLTEEARGKLLAELGEKMSATLSDLYGRVSETKTSSPAEKQQETNKARPAAKPKRADEPEAATVYVLSDGFHLSLLLPCRRDGKPGYVEVGLGERDWALGKGWKWLDGMMAATTQNEGIGVVEYLSPDAATETLEKRKRVWRVGLSAADWGLLLEALENELRLQEVLAEGGDTVKVVKTGGGYSLFHNCHHFALNPFGKTARQLGGGFPMPTQLQEKRLDAELGPEAAVK